MYLDCLYTAWNWCNLLCLPVGKLLEASTLSSPVADPVNNLPGSVFLNSTGLRNAKIVIYKMDGQTIVLFRCSWGCWNMHGGSTWMCCSQPCLLYFIQVMHLCVWLQAMRFCHTSNGCTSLKLWLTCPSIGYSSRIALHANVHESAFMKWVKRCIPVPFHRTM